MERFKQIFEARHQYAKDWKKRTGGKVVGYYEPYFPEEIAYAAGILPVRIIADHEPDDVTDRQMYGNCYPTRDMLNQFLRGRYDYIDGIVYTEGCQWTFNAFQTVTNRFPELWNHYIFVPDYTDGRTSKVVMRSELDVFKTALEKWTGKTVTEEAIDQAIDVYNESRRLMKQVYELRRADQPVLWGSEAITMVLAGQMMDKAEFNPLVKEELKKLEERAPLGDKVRLMLIGSETFDASLEKLIESVGANVVTDELDNGSTYFWNEVTPQKDRLLALSLRYLGRPHTALKDSVWRRRPAYIYQMCEDYMVDGVIFAKQIYCHPHGTDAYAMWKALRERNIPYHFFERDTTMPYEETRLRIEAFVNMLKPGLARLKGWS